MLSVGELGLVGNIPLECFQNQETASGTQGVSLSADSDLEGTCPLRESVLHLGVCRLRRQIFREMKGKTEEILCGFPSIFLKYLGKDASKMRANRCKTGSKISPAALSWSSLIRKRFHNAFFFSPAFFCLAFPVETWDFFENPGFPPLLHRKFPVFHTVFHKLWKTNVEKKIRRRKRFPGCVFCRCGISCGGLCKGVSTGCGNRCRHLPDFPRISPQVFRFHSTIFPPFHPQKISPLLHDFSTKGSWKKNLRRFRQKYGFPLFLPLYNCY